MGSIYSPLVTSSHQFISRNAWTYRIVAVCTKVVGLSDKEALRRRVQMSTVSRAERAADIRVQLGDGTSGEVVEVDLVAE